MAFRGVGMANRQSMPAFRPKMGGSVGAPPAGTPAGSDYARAPPRMELGDLEFAPVGAGRGAPRGEEDAPMEFRDAGGPPGLLGWQSDSDESAIVGVGFSCHNSCMALISRQMKLYWNKPHQKDLEDH